MIYWRSVRDLIAELADAVFVALGVEPEETTNACVPAERERG